MIIICPQSPMLIMQAPILAAVDVRSPNSEPSLCGGMRTSEKLHVLRLSISSMQGCSARTLKSKGPVRAFVSRVLSRKG